MCYRINHQSDGILSVIFVLISTASMSNFCIPPCCIDPSKQCTTQTSKVKKKFNRASTMLNNVFKTWHVSYRVHLPIINYSCMIYRLSLKSFVLYLWCLKLLFSLLFIFTLYIPAVTNNKDLTHFFVALRRDLTTSFWLTFVKLNS